jgi:Tol biopolymer transport system component
MQPRGAPAFTADGRSIIFGRSRGEFGDGPVYDWGLWQIGIDGGDRHPLTAGFGGSGASLFPQLSPDGRVIAFYGYLWEEVGALCWVKREGGHVRKTSLQMRDFAWHPDSQHLVVAKAGPRDEPWETHLVSYDLRTGRITALTPYRRDHADYSPSFSPDATKLAYISSRPAYAGRDSLIVLELKRRRARVVVADADLTDPHGEFTWSADSSRLFYSLRASTSKGKELQIWSVKADGTARRKVLDNAHSPTVVVMRG